MSEESLKHKSLRITNFLITNNWNPSFEIKFGIISVYVKCGLPTFPNLLRMFPHAHKWSVIGETGNQLEKDFFISFSWIFFRRIKEFIVLQFIDLESLRWTNWCLMNILSILTVLTLIKTGAIGCIISVVIVASLFGNTLSFCLFQNYFHVNFLVIRTGKLNIFVSTVDEHLRRQNHMRKLVLFDLVELSGHWRSYCKGPAWLAKPGLVWVSYDGKEIFFQIVLEEFPVEDIIKSIQCADQCEENGELHLYFKSII